MKYEVNPKDTDRGPAFDLWIKAPMPMVTLTKTIDVSKLIRGSRHYKISFNMLMCWCVGAAASRISEFFTIPEHGKLFRYDSLSVNTIVQNNRGGINSCDILFSKDIAKFNRDYVNLTEKAKKESKSSYLEDTMVVGTSALIHTELDSITNQYTEMFCNPMVMWGKYRRKLFKTTLPVSFQFHHVQMDGMQGARFLEEFQKQIKHIKL